MSENSEQKFVDQHMASVRKIILEYGWFVQGVFPTKADDGVPFAYTIGLTDAGLPELLIVGNLRPNTLQNLLNIAAMRHTKKELVPGQDVSDVATVVLRVRQVAVLGAEVQQAHNYYGDADRSQGRVRMLQLLWPDAKGAFPGTPLWTGELPQPLF